MKPVTKAQLTKIHVLLNQFGIVSDKQYIVKEFTNGRETSTRQLTFDEAKSILTYLSKHDPFDIMRRKIFALAYDAGIIYGDSKEDKQMNVAKLNMFLREKGTVKKDLNKMSKEELIKTISQFAQIVKHIADSKTNKAAKSMLADIGITTTKKGANNPL